MVTAPGLRNKGLVQGRGRYRWPDRPSSGASSHHHRFVHGSRGAAIQDDASAGIKLVIDHLILDHGEVHRAVHDQTTQIRRLITELGLCIDQLVNSQAFAGGGQIKNRGRAVGFNGRSSDVDGLIDVVEGLFLFRPACERPSSRLPHCSCHRWS